MNNLKNKTESTDDSFYQELEDEERGSQTSSCLTLIIFCMIIYAGLIFLFWRISPWFWQIPDRAAEIRNSIKIPSNNEQTINDIKKNAGNSSKNLIKNLQDSTRQSIDNQINQTADSVKNSAKNSVQEEVSNQTNQITNDLNH